MISAAEVYRNLDQKDFKSNISSMKVSSFTYPVILLIGLTANAFVLLAILFKGKLTCTKILLANFALADLLMLLTGLYLRYYDQYSEVASKWLCRFFNAADVTMLQISSLSIIMLAYKRLNKLAGRSNLMRERNYKVQIIKCVIVWLFAIMISLPVFIYSDLHSDFTACISTWNPTFGTCYQVFLLLSTYCVPGMAIAVIYSILVRKTKTFLSIISNPTVPHSRIARIVASLVVVFWVLHFPFWFCNFWGMLEPSGGNCSNFWTERAIVLTYVNAMINPFLYGIVTSKCSVDGLHCGFDEEYCSQDDKSDSEQDESEKSGGNKEWEPDYELCNFTTTPKSPKENKNVHLQQNTSKNITKRTDAPDCSLRLNSENMDGAHVENEV